MDITKIIEGIESCPTFKALSRDKKVLLAAIAEPVVYEKGKLVFSMDQIGQSHFYIVYSGHLSLKLKARKAPRREFRKGDLFGEIAIFSDQYRLGTIECLDDTVLLVFDKEKVFNSSLLSSRLMLDVSIALTQKIVSYFYVDDNLSSKELIQQGESETVEFKVTLNQNIGKVVETIIAFMNLNGGTIFIGVEDNGNVKGLDFSEDERLLNQQRDSFTRRICSSAERKIGKDFLDSIKIDWESIDGMVVMRIDCLSADSPIFYTEREGNEEKEVYIVRTMTGNQRLTRTSEIVSHITKKFKT